MLFKFDKLRYKHIVKIAEVTANRIKKNSNMSMHLTEHIYVGLCSGKGYSIAGERKHSQALGARTTSKNSSQSPFFSYVELTLSLERTTDICVKTRGLGRYPTQVSHWDSSILIHVVKPDALNSYTMCELPISEIALGATREVFNIKQLNINH